MELTRENLDSFFFSINGNFNKGLGQVWSGFEKFAVVLNLSLIHI